MTYWRALTQVKGENMSATKLQLQILTSESAKVDELVDMVIMRCTSGDIGILPGHLPLSAVLEISPLRIINDGEERLMAVFGGVVNVKDDAVTILTELAEWPEDIDLARAENAFEEASAAYEDLPHNKMAERRAKVRLEVGVTLAGRR